MKDNFSSYRTVIHNVHRMAYTFLKTGIMVHILVCVWIWIIIWDRNDPQIEPDMIGSLKDMKLEDLKQNLFGIYVT